MHVWYRSRSFAGLLFATLTVLLALGGCAALTAHDPVRVSVVGIEPLVGQGLEMRFDVKLRLQNPNDAQIDYDGVALDLELNGRPFASGVSDARGSVPRFGEQVLSVPVTVSAFSAARQAFGLADVTASGKLPYVLRGKLAGGMFGSVRFTDSGTLSLPASSGGYGGGD
ncbi:MULTISPECIES: LEA type 2 family protein [Burkholderia]|uniref:LEA type 2 family protein n=1 Tax=Burkholderia TaxID=32008 RepID=UPI0003A06419|nr:MULTISPECIES: LEA type 2 family protein [Burkholderia]KST73112.1 water stress/hypersensitive response domain-containing protein [Burkholderia humptydooensis]